MMPVSHVQLRPQSVSTRAGGSNRMLAAVDLTATGVIVNKQFLKVTYGTYK